ncbi:MAG TPA: SufE family protein, partial [Rhabdochlamydiaceae bacterium]|nr:SufE family protein [Rhabdochlamydiaceae bacterium]
TCQTPEGRYQKIIEMGRQLPPFNPTSRTPANLVPGCQSIMYLETTLNNGKLFLNADSEALISKGLAALLIYVYSDESPATIAHYPPTFIQEIGLLSAISPARSNGLASLYHKLRQEALKYLK